RLSGYAQSVKESPMRAGQLPGRSQVSSPSPTYSWERAGVRVAFELRTSNVELRTSNAERRRQPLPSKFVVRSSTFNVRLPSFQITLTLTLSHEYVGEGIRNRLRAIVLGQFQLPRCIRK